MGVQRSLIAGLRWPESWYYGVVDLTVFNTSSNSNELGEAESEQLRKHSLQAPVLMIAVIRKFGRHGIHLGWGIAEAQRTDSDYSTWTYDPALDRNGYKYYAQEKSTEFESAAKLAYLYGWSHVGIGCGAILLSSGDGIAFANLALGWI